MILPRYSIPVSWFLISCGGVALAADVVRIAPAEGDGPAFGIEGRILDYTGREVVILPLRGAERRFAADRVVEIQTEWPSGYEEGLRALQGEDYAAAQQQLLAANRTESRAWARRIILGELARALLGLGKTEQAAEVVLAILTSDPTSPHLELLPLAWTSDPAVPQSKAEAWLAQPGHSAESLLGASHLLATSRSGAVNALNRLTSDPDPRIALLAEAQLWRTRVASADAAQVERWRAAIERLPTGLRPGASLVLGEALRRLGRYDEAALAFLRVPIHAPQQSDLAARALLSAAECLGEGGHPEEALRLAQDILTDYATAPSARAAEDLVQRLGE